MNLYAELGYDAADSNNLSLLDSTDNGIDYSRFKHFIKLFPKSFSKLPKGYTEKRKLRWMNRLL